MLKIMRIGNFGRRFEYSNTYLIDQNRVTYDQVKGVLGGYSRFKQEGEDGKTTYLLPGNIRVTSFVGSEGRTILWVTRDSKSLPREMKRFLEVTRARWGGSSQIPLEERLNFEMRTNFDLNKVGEFVPD